MEDAPVEPTSTLAEVTDLDRRRLSRAQSAVMPWLTSEATDRLPLIRSWTLNSRLIRGLITSGDRAQALAQVGQWAEHLGADGVQEQPHCTNFVLIFCQADIRGVAVRVWSLVAADVTETPAATTPEA
jgi:hypothetical protein